MGAGTPSYVRIWDELKPFFKLHGFDCYPQLNQFRRPIPGGFQSVVLSMSAYPEGLMMEAQVGVRMDAVEEMVFPLLKLPASYRPHSMSLVTPIQNLFVPSSVRVFLENQRDERRALSQLEHRMTQRGFSFLNQISSPSALDEMYNDQPLRTLGIVHNQVHRCFRGMALAKVTNRNNQVELAELYRVQLHQCGARPDQIARFEQFLSFLKQYSPN